MTRWLQSDVLKVFLYVAASLVLGAVLAPVIYNVGMGLAEVTRGKETNGFFAWLGQKAWDSRDNFGRFYDRALLLSALVLLFPLLAWMKMGRKQGNHRDTPWSLRLPDSAVVTDCGQPLRRNPSGWYHLMMGFILGAGFLLVSGWLMIQAGMFMWRDAQESVTGVANPFVMEIDFGKALRKAVPTAVVVSVVEEVLFRGVLLGIFLRAMKPAPAIASLAFLFAFVHFLQPPLGFRVTDPEASNAGFILLGQIFSNFADPRAFMGRFMVLAAVGVVLAIARLRTGSLWLPIGLHAGWIFAYTLFKASTWPVADLPQLARLLVGMSLLEGLLPLVMVVMTGILVAVLTRPDDEAERV